MKNRHTARRSLDERTKGKTDWERVDALTDEEIEAAASADPDAPPLLDDAFFQTAELIFPDAAKQRITIRLDRNVVDFFKAAGPGYQSRMNAVLKAYVIRSLKDRQGKTP